MGKSTAAKHMRRQIPHGAVVEIDHLRGMIAAVRWVDTAQHWIALEHGLMLAKSFIERAILPVVIIDTFSRGKLRSFLERVECSFQIASLYASDEALTDRVENRCEKHFKDLTVCRLLNDEVRANRYPNETLVDTTHLSPIEVADRLANLTKATGGLHDA